MESWREELYHTGTPGMKWGVRRYQNKDGTLTPAGRLHYGRKLGKAMNWQLDVAEGKTKTKIHSSILEKSKTLDDNLVKLSKNAGNLTGLSNNAGNLARFGKSINEQHARSKTKAIDLSKMSDSDLQRAINRFNLERNYKEILASQDASTRASATDFINTAATVTGIAASIAGIAASVHALRSKG